MKYKIRVVEFEDGKAYYLPLVKEHWWTGWKMAGCSGFVYRISLRGGQSTMEAAKNILQRFIENRRCITVKSIKDTKVAINIVEQENG